MPTSAATIDQLRVEVRADLDKFERELRLVKTNVRDTARESERSFSLVRRSVADAAGALSTFRGLIVGAAAAVGIQGIGSLGRAALDTADSIDKVSQRLGIGVEALQEYRFAAKLNGVEQQTLDMALQRFTRRTAEAAQGTGEAKDALKEMGVVLTDGAGRLRSSEDLLDDVADALARVEDPATRVRLAFKLFDSEGVSLINVLKGGSAALAELRREARETGHVIGSETVTELVRAKDEIEKLTHSISVGFTKAIGGAIAHWRNLRSEFGIRVGAPVEELVEQIELMERRLGELREKAANTPAFAAKGMLQAIAEGEQRLAGLQAQLRDQQAEESPAAAPAGRPAASPASLELTDADRKALADRSQAFRDHVSSLVQADKRRQQELRDSDARELQRARDVIHEKLKIGLEADRKRVEQAAELERHRLEQIKNFSERVANRIVEDGEINFRRLAESFEREFIARALSALIQSGLTELGGFLGGASKGSGAGSLLAGGLLKTLGLFTGGGFAGFFANGGTIPAGRFGITGERGPEIVRGPATVDPNVGGGGVVVQLITDQPSDAVKVQELGDSGGRRFVRVVVGQVFESIARGDADQILRSRFQIQPRTV